MKKLIKDLVYVELGDDLSIKLFKRYFSKKEHKDIFTALFSPKEFMQLHKILIGDLKALTTDSVFEPIMNDDFGYAYEKEAKIYGEENLLVPDTEPEQAGLPKPTVKNLEASYVCGDENSETRVSKYNNNGMIIFEIGKRDKINNKWQKSDIWRGAEIGYLLKAISEAVSYNWHILKQFV